ncbi:G2/M phase-specific E3 ubiquitin-protein ligase-like isoform X1, partial [Astyanax mexicanus]
LAASDVVSNLSLKIDPTSFNRFSINRANVWDGAIRGFKRSAYNPSYDMLVKFSDDVGQTEDSIDTGGPKREFLTLLLDAIRTRRVFEGRTPRPTLLLLQPGLGPSLAENLFEYLIGKVKSIEAPIEDIPDEEVKNSLFEISNATSVSQLQSSTDKHSSMLQTAGCFHLIKKLEDKEKIVHDYIQWYFVYRNHFSIQRFKEGLATLDVANALEQHPSLLQPFMCYTEARLTADTVEDIFHVKLSPPGSTKRHEETRLLAYWRDYLLHVEDQSGLSLQDVLMFGTGLKEVPPAAIKPQPQLTFEWSSRFPLASTCANTLKIPILPSYEDFQEAMDYGIQNSPGFGLP